MRTLEENRQLEYKLQIQEGQTWAAEIERDGALQKNQLLLKDVAKAMQKNYSLEQDKQDLQGHLKTLAEDNTSLRAKLENARLEFKRLTEEDKSQLTAMKKECDYRSLKTSPYHFLGFCLRVIQKGL